MGNETEEWEIEGLDSETEVMDSDNEVVDNEVLPPERKGYILRNPPNFNFSDKRSTWRSMGWNNLIFGFNELHSGQQDPVIWVRLYYENNYISSIIVGLSNLRKPKISVINSGERVWHI